MNPSIYPIVYSAAAYFGWGTNPSTCIVFQPKGAALQLFWRRNKPVNPVFQPPNAMQRMSISSLHSENTLKHAMSYAETWVPKMLRSTCPMLNVALGSAPKTTQGPGISISQFMRWNLEKGEEWKYDTKWSRTTQKEENKAIVKRRLKTWNLTRIQTVSVLVWSE